VGICAVDPKGRFEYFNDAFAGLLGYSNHELAGREFIDLLPPEDAAILAGAFRKIVELGTEPRNFEFRALTKDGHVFHLMAKPTKSEINGKVVGFQAIIIDITERKRAEEALRESEEKYRAIVELVPDPIVALNSKGVVTSVNPTTLRLIGYPKDEIVGKHFKVSDYAG
jgi:two-component system cell cycle sensor histidine kinase/response regulator CckA